MGSLKAKVIDGCSKNELTLWKANDTVWFHVADAKVQRTQKTFHTRGAVFIFYDKPACLFAIAAVFLAAETPRKGVIPGEKDCCTHATHFAFPLSL